MSSDQEEMSHMIVVGQSILRVEESPFLEVEKPVAGSIQLMRKGVLRRSSNYVDCGMRHRDEPRAGRCCLEGQTADSRLLESAEANPHRFSGPS